MRSFIYFFLVLVMVGCGEGFEVDKSAYTDPEKVFDAALQDHRDGNFGEALRKHIWFHQYAVEYQSSLHGVRLSYALSDWRCLASKYPEALVALTYFSDKAEEKIKEGVDVYSAFNDFESINGELADEERTVSLFMWLDSNSPELAKRVSGLAQPALIDAGKFSLIGKYLDVEKEVKMQFMQLDMVSRFDIPGEAAGEMKAFAYESFADAMQTLVAILAKNGKHKEMEWVSEKAEEKWKDDGFRARLALAKSGIFPEQEKSKSPCCGRKQSGRDE